MTVITRFAPSPTGFLHIGSARTALFNWLFARHHGGKYLLRIEDTDRERSTQEAVDAILDGLSWLGLDHDEEVVYQFPRASRHAEVAKKLLDEGKAYYCYCSQEELAAMRAKAREAGTVFRYDGRWRDRSPEEAPPDVKPVVRLKVHQEGSTTIQDLVQGEVTVANTQLDDMILLRSDGTPTYMLAVVVDDHDMGVTHTIRGDDHLTNAFRQKQIYEAMAWDTPAFVHIPLIHGQDGAKLSKRHGALGVGAYREMGFLPEAICNYLLRLGWAHGDHEIIPLEQAIQWFDTKGLGKSPSRFDMVKLTNLNAHYMKLADDQRLTDLIVPVLAEKLGHAMSDASKDRLVKGMHGLKQRAKTLQELAANALFYVVDSPLPLTEKAEKILQNGAGELIGLIIPEFEKLSSWEIETIENLVKKWGETRAIKLKDIAQALRVGTTWSTISPSVFEVLAVLGREETLRRLQHTISAA